MKLFSLYSKILSLLLILFTMTAIAATSETIQIEGLRVSHMGNDTRLVFELSKPTPYHFFFLKKPERLVVDLNNAELATSLKGLPLAATPVKDIRAGKQSHGRLRLVFDLSGKVKTTLFSLKPYQNYGHRLVIDMTSSGKAAPKVTAIRGKEKPKPVVTAPLKTKGRDIIVVIDPGHGGKDPGATGPRGIKEKNVVLKISKDLQRMLNRQPGIKAVLTRTGDYYISLRERLRIAREAKGDMFIAVHADAFKNSSARGASVFALSQRGASSEAARWLAEKENYSELGNINLNEYQGRYLRSVLIDLSQTATIGTSLNIGKSVLHELGKFARLHNNRVEQARFVVLKSPDIPSILVETGFISNPYEERNLNSRGYQLKIANALMDGVLRYFYKSPPRGTMLAQMRNKPEEYVVVTGDTLKEIANRFDISVASLQSFNKLKSDNIHVGQNLLIPRRAV